MALEPRCMRCPAPLLESAGSFACPEHGPGVPLWRCAEPSYDDFAEHLDRAGELPTLIRWPLGPGWRVTDFACVAEPDGPSRATLSCCSGATRADGPVDVLVVVEEPGTGLGARVAGVPGHDPGPEAVHGPPPVRIACGSHQVPLWPVSTSSQDPEFDRSVVVGELHGRWLWVVVRPAPALLMLPAGLRLRAAGELGPLLVEVPFEGPAPRW